MVVRLSPRRRRRGIFRVQAGVLATAAVIVPALMGATSAPADTGPSDCNSSFDPYSYSQAAVSACGYQTYPRGAVRALAGGGDSYDYDVQGVNVRFYVPPASFNPATATNAQLDEYGFPERPAATPDSAGALSTWQTQMSTWAGPESAPPFLAESNAQSDTVWSYNWSGYSLTAKAGTFTHAETWYVEPSYGSSVCSSNAASIWAGIGGYNDGGTVSQNGTAHNVPGIGNHQAWWEVWPYNNMTAVGLYGHPGYEFDASVRRLSTGWRYYFYDYYSRKTVTLDVTIAAYDGKTAEAVAERPTINGNWSYLSNFGTLHFDETLVNGEPLNSQPGGSARHGIHMNAKVTGDTLAEPSDISGDGAFTVNQEHCK